jgi:anti-sigma-K factor RskA
MSTPIPDDEKHTPLHEALRRDAARLTEPPFDAALHRATIRRIRALSDTTAVWLWKPALAVAAIVVVAFIALRLPHSPEVRKPTPPDIAAVLASTRAAVASLSFETSPGLPAWMSPTASLLDLQTLPPTSLHQP